MPIAGYEGRYDIHPDGRVWSHVRRRGKFLSATASDGYALVTLSKDKTPTVISIHRLLAIAYIPNPDNKPYVDHVDRDRANNSLDNLRWVTSQENSQNRTIQKKSTTGVTGVGYVDGRRSPWLARIHIDGKRKNKFFATEEEAIAWRRAMELEHFIQ